MTKISRLILPRQGHKWAFFGHCDSNFQRLQATARPVFFWNQIFLTRVRAKRVGLEQGWIEVEALRWRLRLTLKLRFNLRSLDMEALRSPLARGGLSRTFCTMWHVTTLLLRCSRQGGDCARGGGEPLWGYPLYKIDALSTRMPDFYRDVLEVISQRRRAGGTPNDSPSLKCGISEISASSEKLGFNSDRQRGSCTCTTQIRIHFGMREGVGGLTPTPRTASFTFATVLGEPWPCVTKRGVYLRKGV